VKYDLKVKWKARSLLYAKNLIRLQTNVKTRIFKKGEFVYKEGDEGQSMFLVDEVEDGCHRLLELGVVVLELGQVLDQLGEELNALLLDLHSLTLVDEL